MKILVLCTGNSCRSQMAHGYLAYFLKEKAEIFSAGIETHGVNPWAISTMAADGVDISQHTSNHISEYESEVFEYVITVCDHAREQCPYFPATSKIIHHDFPDPSKFIGSEEAKRAEFVRVRELIKYYCMGFSDGI